MTPLPKCHCGGTPKIVGNRKIGYYVECQNVECLAGSGSLTNREDAVKDWLMECARMEKTK
ncbi:MAG: hypothetical protein WC683_06945 [bacterium]